MNRRLAACAVAAGLLLCRTASAAPPDTRACDNLAIEDLCNMAGGNEELPAQCTADGLMSATDTGPAAGKALRVWDVQAWSFHACPNSQGDMTRVGGVMRWEFNGVGPDLPRTCSGLSECSTDSGTYQIDGPATAIGLVHVGTYTVDEPFWANGGTTEYVFP